MAFARDVSNKNVNLTLGHLEQWRFWLCGCRRARRQARLRCWSAAFAAAFALPSGRLATPWTQLGRQVAAI
ncbi:MAG: hypothetical protein GY877_03715, partial [Hyphomicrobium sp.]|nr:hypothetical protein [Hyphomicrobium sp.]